MQALYVLDFDVSSSDNLSEPYSCLREHLASWVSGPSGSLVGPEALETSGGLELQVDPAHIATRLPRQASWSVAGTPEADALRLELRTTLSGGSAFFVTKCTISRSEHGPTRLRVELGREVTSGWLSPVSIAMLRRPGLLRTVLSDARVRVATLGQVVDGRYVKVYDEHELPVITSAAEATDRLPLLITRPKDDAAWDFARRASNELAGLAQVVCLASWPSYTGFNATLPLVAVPDGGARLLWPDLDGARHPDFSRGQIEHEDPSHLTQKLMRMLAPLSVVARGQDRGWAEAHQAARRRDANLAAERLNEARAAGDQQAELTALEERNSALQAELDEWVAEHEAQGEQITDLRQRSADAERLAYETAQWKRQYFDLLASRGTPSEVDWSNAPDLNPADAQPLFDFIESASAGRCLFTSNAAKVWRKSGYPFPEVMRETLVNLARAAVQFADDQGGINSRLTDWFKENHGLNVALSDRDLEDKGLSTFPFEDEVLSRLPHVTLDDHTKPDRVGRVYFAHQSAPARFVVDHVGLKLYGL